MITIKLPGLASKPLAATSKSTRPCTLSRRSSTLILLFSIAALSLSLVFSADAARVISRIEYPDAPGTTVILKSVFETIPNSGYAPLLVEIVNSTDRDRQWRLRSTSRDPYGNLMVESSFPLPCKASSSAVHSIMVPIAADGEGYGQIVRLNIAEPSLGQRSANLQSSSTRQWPSIAISEKLAGPFLKDLTDEMDRLGRFRGGNAHFAHTFNPSELPSDWRALSGLDAMMISVDEWQNLSAPPKKAILEWNRLGGVIHFYPSSQSNGSQSLQLDDTTSLLPGEHKYRSLGKVQLHKSKTLGAKATIRTFQKYTPKTQQFDTDYRSNWGVLQEFGTRSFNSWVVLIVLAAFGIAVGPVNFWILAKPDQRHRLFITTPLLSITASVILGLIILIGDGIGGKGLRFVAINLEPAAGERRAYITQEQVARTGLLLRTAFEMEDHSMLTPLRLQATRWSHYDTDHSRSNKLAIQNQHMTGHWFRSRSESAHLVQAARPTRGRIELVNQDKEDGKPPRLFSSLGFDADQLYYVDSDGEFWRSVSTVKTGHPVDLEACARSDAKTWWSSQSTHASRNLARRLQLVLDEGRNTFLLSTKDDRANPIDAGDFIRWSNSKILVFGSPLSVNEAVPQEDEAGPASTIQTPINHPNSASTS